VIPTGAVLMLARECLLNRTYWKSVTEYKLKVIYWMNRIDRRSDRNEWRLSHCDGGVDSAVFTF
jgi:hypothetical protein